MDLTRSIRRAGRNPTGIDRVEVAYLSHLLAETPPLYGLVRSAFGYLLLGPSGMEALRDRIIGTLPWGPPDMLSRLPRGRTEAQRRAEAEVRRHAIARVIPQRLGPMLKARLPSGTAYLNVGHSNLTHRVLAALSTQQDFKISVMIHDVIPLEYPQFQRLETIAPFREKMQRVSEFADSVIYNSDDTRARAERILGEFGRAPCGVVAHLGVTVADPDGPPNPRPYFVTVGTIEPRKNHAFLLDLWEEMGPEAPPLYICGARGWANEEVFARLDALPQDGPVREMSHLSDPEISALVAQAAGALYPSFAEGYGLPVVEALALGTPVLCSPLATFKEIAGKNAVYADVNDRYLWINKIKKWAEKDPGAEKVEFVPSNWTEHFKAVLRLT